MRKLIVRLVIAAALVATGDALRRAAAIEHRLADVQQQFTTFTAPAAPTAYDEVERALSFAARLPLVGEAMLADVRTLRAAASYWNGDYAALAAAPRDPDATENPAILFLTANASYRSALLGPQDRGALIRGLDATIQRYGDLLIAAPGHVDAAYNYEFTVRLRDALARGREDPGAKKGVEPNMQGEEGKPPEGTRDEDFEVIVPLRPDERRDQIDAGDTSKTTRKG